MNASARRRARGIMAIFGTVLMAMAPLAIAVQAFSCRRSTTSAPPPRPALGSVEVRESLQEGRTAPSLDADEIATVARRVLRESGLFAEEASDAARPAGGVVRVKITVGIEFTEVTAKGVARTGVRVRLDTRPSDAPGAIDDDLSAGGEQVYEVTSEKDRRGLGQHLVERTLTDLLAGFVARARLRTASLAEVHAAITGDGGTPALRQEAIRIAGARGMRDEASALLPLLQDENEALRDAALGALIALRDQRAVPALTRNRSLRDRHEMRKILDAIAILGGDEARDYLSFVADSHDDEEIRALASEARRRLERRRDH
jgi:hypothetical protein